MTDSAARRRKRGKRCDRCEACDELVGRSGVARVHRVEVAVVKDDRVATTARIGEDNRRRELALARGANDVRERDLRERRHDG